MAMSELHGRQGRQSGRPLCSTYQLAYFAPQAIRVVVNSGSHCVTWALGAQGDGSREVLGAWQHSIDDGAPKWRELFDDLARRGVERIRFAVNADTSAAAAAVGSSDRTFFDAASVKQRPEGTAELAALGSTHGRLMWSSSRDTSDLPRRVRQTIRRCEEAALALQRGLRQAASRHGPFQSPADAARFVETWLEDAGNRERRRRYAAQRRTELPQAALAS